MRTKFEIYLLTPAKLNLFLKVVGRDKNGYHLLQSLFVPVSLYDKVSIGKLKKRVIKVSLFPPLNISPEETTIFKAASLFFEKLGEKGGVTIMVKKNIPPGAGLGGGSSDAAAILKGLNTLYGCPLSSLKLRELATEVGSDVPFFINPEPSFVEGIGEKISPVEIDPMWFVLIYPGFESSTPDVYREYDNLTEGEEISKIKHPDFKNLIGENDLETAFLKLFPKAEEAKEIIVKTGRYDFVGLSGSGSTYFVGFYTEKRRDKFFGKLVSFCRPEWRCSKVNITTQEV